jgi:endonuclease YncB( thermonuclease family)
MHDRRARFVENHDGDTVTMILDQDFDDMKKINIRLANVWAPELDEHGGIQTKAYVSFLLSGRNSIEEWPFIVHTSVTKTDKPVKSFDRYVATVMSPDGKWSLNSELMKYITESGFKGGIGSITRKGES